VHIIACLPYLMGRHTNYVWPIVKINELSYFEKGSSYKYIYIYTSQTKNDCKNRVSPESGMKLEGRGEKVRTTSHSTHVVYPFPNFPPLKIQMAGQHSLLSHIFMWLWAVGLSKAPHTPSRAIPPSKCRLYSRQERRFRVVEICLPARRSERTAGLALPPAPVHKHGMRAPSMVQKRSGVLVRRHCVRCM
jgi:hypothetical protein